MRKQTIRSMQERIERLQKQIGERRDKLREIEEQAAAVASDCDEAMQYLREARMALSRLQ